MATQVQAQMKTSPMLIVRLHEGSLTSGVVVAHPIFFSEALRYLYAGPDGAAVPNLVLWQGVALVGAEVTAWEPNSEEFEILHALCQSRAMTTQPQPPAPPAWTGHTAHAAPVADCHLCQSPRRTTPEDDDATAPFFTVERPFYE